MIGIIEGESSVTFSVTFTHSLCLASTRICALWVAGESYAGIGGGVNDKAFHTSSVALPRPIFSATTHAFGITCLAGEVSG